MTPYETFKAFAQLQSIAWTLPMLALCIIVVFKAFKPAKNANKKGASNSSEKMRWFLTGIFIGFLGNILDNTYWAFYWGAGYLQMQEPVDALISFGVFPNLVFRQGMTLLAAYCHIKAFIPAENKLLAKKVHKIFIATIILGQGYILLLIAVKYGLFLNAK